MDIHVVVQADRLQFHFPGCDGSAGGKKTSRGSAWVMRVSGHQPVDAEFFAFSRMLSACYRLYLRQPFLGASQTDRLQCVGGSGGIHHQVCWRESWRGAHAAVGAIRFKGGVPSLITEFGACLAVRQLGRPNLLCPIANRDDHDDVLAFVGGATWMQSVAHGCQVEGGITSPAALLALDAHTQILLRLVFFGLS